MTKDLTELGAEVDATGIHIFYWRATSRVFKVSTIKVSTIRALTISVKIPGTRFKFDNRLGCSHAISEVFPSCPILV